MTRERHFKAMDLGGDGLYIVHSGFVAHAPIKTIVQLVKEATGETISEDSVQRYRRWWRSEYRPAQEAQELAREMATALRDLPSDDLRRIIEQKIEQLYLLQLRHLEGKDPLEVAGLALEQQKVSMRRDKLALDAGSKRLHEERLRLDKEKLELQREKKAAINRPALFLEFFKMMVAKIVPVDPAAAEVLNKHFDRLLAEIKTAHA